MMQFKQVTLSDGTIAYLNLYMVSAVLDRSEGAVVVLAGADKPLTLKENASLLLKDGAIS